MCVWNVGSVNCVVVCNVGFHQHRLCCPLLSRLHHIVTRVVNTCRVLRNMGALGIQPA